MTKSSMKELAKVRHFIYSCRKCGVCRYKMTGKMPYVCPVKQASSGFETFSSRGKIILAQALLEGQIDPSEGLASAAYSCTMCGNCMTQCGASDPDTNSPLVDNAAIVEALRADLYREHPEYVPETYHRALAATRQFANPWGMPRSARGKWAKGLTIKDAQKEKSEVVLFAGCTMSLNPELTPRIKKAVAVLKAAGVDLGTLGAAEPCCGSVQQRIGARQLAAEMIANNAQLLNSLGCTTIVTLCAGCCNMLKKEYASAGGKLVPKIYHLVEYLARLIKEKKRAFTKEQKIRLVYHDPCHLGRHMGIYVAPREVLNAIPGIELIERSANRENTICCGAGGGMRLFESGTLSATMGMAAFESAAQTGAGALISACPFCEMNLEAAGKAANSQMKVLDVIDLVYETVINQ